MTTYQRLHLFLDPQSRTREEVGATGADLQDPYQVMIPDTVGHFVKFLPYDTATNLLDTPINLQSLRIRIEPNAQRYEPRVRDAIPRRSITQTTSALQLPTLDLYTFSAIVYDRSSKTLAITFTAPLDERLLKIGYVLSLVRLAFDAEAAYENFCQCLRWWVENNHQFVVVGVTTNDDRQIESACGVEHARQSTAHSASVEAEASVYACPSASSVKQRSTSTIILLLLFDLENNPRMNDIFSEAHRRQELYATS